MLTNDPAYTLMLLKVCVRLKVSHYSLSSRKHHQQWSLTLQPSVLLIYATENLEIMKTYGCSMFAATWLFNHICFQVAFCDNFIFSTLCSSLGLFLFSKCLSNLEALFQTFKMKRKTYITLTWLYFHPAMLFKAYIIISLTLWAFASVKERTCTPMHWGLTLSICSTDRLCDSWG